MAENKALRIVTIIEACDPITATKMSSGSHPLLIVFDRYPLFVN